MEIRFNNSKFQTIEKILINENFQDYNKNVK